MHVLKVIWDADFSGDTSSQSPLPAVLAQHNGTNIHSTGQRTQLLEGNNEHDNLLTSIKCAVLREQCAPVIWQFPSNAAGPVTS